MARVERCPSCRGFVPVPDHFVSGELRCPECRCVFEVDDPDRERFSEEPDRDTLTRSRRSDRDWEDDDRDERWLRRLRRDRQQPAKKAQAAGVMMMVTGGLLILAALGCGVGAALAWEFETGEDRIFLTVMLAFIGLACLVCGPLIFLGGMRLRALRSYGLVMTATIMLLVVGMLTCVPLAIAAIWPFVVLMDSEVKEAFRQREEE